MTIVLLPLPCSMPESERRARVDRAYDLLWRIYDRIQKKTDDGDSLGRDAPSSAGETAQVRDRGSSQRV